MRCFKNSDANTGTPLKSARNFEQSKEHAAVIRNVTQVNLCCSIISYVCAEYPEAQQGKTKQYHSCTANIALVAACTSIITKAISHVHARSENDQLNCTCCAFADKHLVTALLKQHSWSKGAHSLPLKLDAACKCPH